ncbi:MAG: EscU/YscU/HrcU family type III secretion system export apparatus switch protein, partial [Mesorhizobium sp.]
MSAEKTEKPTPKRLRDLRRKGQVAHSSEVVSAALTIAF